MTSKSDLKRYDALQRIGCVCCKLLGFHNHGDIHHIVSSGYRRLSGGNNSTVVLCPYHHRGIIPQGMDRQEVELNFGPSLANGSKPFHARFGTQAELLARTNEVIK